MSKAIIKQSPPFGYNQLEQLLNQTLATPVKDLRFQDLAVPTLTCHGVYAFCEGDNYHVLFNGKQLPEPKYWYIGSTTSNSMVGRIGQHFSLGLGDYSNVLVKRIARAIAKGSNKQLFNNSKRAIANPQDPGVQLANQIIEKAYDIFLDLKFKCLLFQEAPNINLKDPIQDVEKKFIKDLEPAFNNPKSKISYIQIFDKTGKQIIFP